MSRTAQQLARVGDPLEVRLKNLIRRKLITATRGALWKLLGIRGLEGDETGLVEVFSGIGISARPPASGKPEAIVVNVGGAKAPVIVATRDKATLDAVLDQLGELEVGSTLVFSGTAVIYVRANGTVEIRTPGGVAVPLATKADVDAIRNALDGHTHTYLPGTGTATTTTLNPSVPAPTGTTVLKAQ
jgi:phage gp45-like